MSNKPLTGRAGFTLLELLIVVAILAAIAFTATGAFRGISEDANDRLAHAEMLEIAGALKRFKQDTGYWPKTGPFDLNDSSQSREGKVLYVQLPSWVGSDPEKRQWFDSPANFYQLYGQLSPLDANKNGKRDSNEHSLAFWDAETARGWRGPYLLGHTDGYVTIGNEVNKGEAGHPAIGNQIADVPGIADPFERRPDAGFFQWRATPFAVEPDESKGKNPPLDKWGRPYLVFGLADGNPKIVSMGSDGEYGTNDDLVLYVEGMDGVE